MTTRRLAAILTADVVGFSSMMEKDEEGTLRQAGAAVIGIPRALASLLAYATAKARAECILAGMMQGCR
jgi:class 3 adenylate cyclase